MDSKSDKAIAVGKLLMEHKGRDTIVLDVSEQSSWTDIFIITTVNSLGHLRGLVRQLKKFLDEKGIEINHRHKKLNEDGWELMDCGYMVIHLMNTEKRDFYNLEKLWHSSKCLLDSRDN